MTTDRLMGELMSLADQIRPLQKELDRLIPMRDRRIVKAIGEGRTATEVAKAAGVSRQHVTKIAPAKATRRAAADEETVTHIASTAELIDEDDVPAFPAGTPLLSQYASKGVRRRYGKRVTAYVQWEDGGTARVLLSTGQRRRIATPTRSAAEILNGVTTVSRDVRRVYLLGDAPGAWNADRSKSTAAAIRGWFYAHAPGWVVPAGRGHVLHDVDTPIGRWAQEHSKDEVEIYRMDSWLAGVESVDTAKAAMDQLERMITAEFGEGATWLSTPGTTGRDLWTRTIPHGKEFPVLSPELRELIRRTSGQGRSEILETPSRDIPNLVYMDGRFMYGALTWGLPTGDPRRVTGQQWAAMSEAQQGKALLGRGRWRVRVTVPKGWAHVGVLPARTTADEGTWTYPADPGRTWVTWADGCEIDLARREAIVGTPWRIDVLEGITWDEGKPLNTWADKLKRMWTEADEAEGRLRAEGDTRGATVAALVKGALRKVMLFAIGAFASGSHPVYGSTPAAHPELVPHDIIGAPTRDGDMLVWSREAETKTGWIESMRHPEWAATVWARARARLLHAPGDTGALHVPRANVVAFRTDAIYLTQDPGWADDGKIGRFRHKGTLPGPVPAPTSYAELFALRDRAEGNA